MKAVAHPFYPYRDVFWKGLSLYFTGLRAFVTDRLQRRAGIGAKELVLQSLRGDGKRIFEENLETAGDNWKDALDIVHLSSVIHANWQELFSLEFTGVEPIPRHVSKLAEARNIYAHDLTGDMNRAYVKNCLNLMGKVLLAIGRRDLHMQIQDVLEQLGGSPVKEDQDLLQVVIDPIELNKLLGAWYWDLPKQTFHVSIDALWLGMQKGQRKSRAGLQRREELEDSLALGIANRVFGRAEGYEPETGQYVNLTLGLHNPLAVYLRELVRGDTLIVNADWAALHLDDRESLYP